MRRFNLETVVGSQKSAQALRVGHEITGTSGRDDLRASQGAKSAHTGSMEAMSDAGGAQKRPALRGGAKSLAEVNKELSICRDAIQQFN